MHTGSRSSNSSLLCSSVEPYHDIHVTHFLQHFSILRNDKYDDKYDDDKYDDKYDDDKYDDIIILRIE